MLVESDAMTGQVERKKGGQLCAITQMEDLWKSFLNRTPVILSIIGIRRLASWGGGCGRFGIF